MLSYRWKINKWEDEPQSADSVEKVPRRSNVSHGGLCLRWTMKGGGLASDRDGIAADIIKSYQPRILKIKKKKQQMYIFQQRWPSSKSRIISCGFTTWLTPLGFSSAFFQSVSYEVWWLIVRTIFSCPNNCLHGWLFQFKNLLCQHIIPVHELSESANYSSQRIF